MLEIAHICACKHYNAGDRYLLYCLRHRFNEFLGEVNWRVFDTCSLFSAEDIESIRECAMVVIGGGGLILPDTWTTSPTGWQFGLTQEQLCEIDSPITVFALGWNLFRGQLLSQAAASSLCELSKRSCFFGFRHRADIVQAQICLGLSQKIDLSFCPSLAPPEAPLINGTVVGFVMAYDRPAFRFRGLDEEVRIVRELAQLVSILIKSLKQRVFFYVHVARDMEFVKRIVSAACCAYGVHVIALYGRSFGQIRAAYEPVAMVFSMRGHGQMIPIGMGRKVVSLVTHDKITSLTNDLLLDRTTVELEGEDLCERCLIAYEEALHTDFKSRAHFASAQVKESIQVACCRAGLPIKC